MQTSNTAEPALHADIDTFYTEQYDEVDRLGRNMLGRLERERTLEVLLRVLPPPPAHLLAVAAAEPPGAPDGGCAGPG